MTAAETYAARINETSNLLAELEAVISIHRAKEQADKGNWGHAGDLGYVNEKLRDVAAFLGGNAQ